MAVIMIILKVRAHHSQDTCTASTGGDTLTSSTRIRLSWYLQRTKSNDQKGTECKTDEGAGDRNESGSSDISIIDSTEQLECRENGARGQRLDMVGEDNCEHGR